MDVTPWMEFGGPFALLALVLTGAGIGLGWFLKAYLRQQKEEFVARRKEQERKDTLLMEQHEFIRDLATASMKETAAALAQMSDVRSYMGEMTRSLAIINEQLQEHAVHSRAVHDVLKEQHQAMALQVTQLERTSIKMHKGA